MTNPAFTGSVAELDAEFVTHVKQLVEILLKGLVPKQEAGKTLRCRDLIHYFKAFASILNRSHPHEDSCLVQLSLTSDHLHAHTMPTLCPQLHDA